MGRSGERDKEREIWRGVPGKKPKGKWDDRCALLSTKGSPTGEIKARKLW